MVDSTQKNKEQKKVKSYTLEMKKRNSSFAYVITVHMGDVNTSTNLQQESNFSKFDDKNIVKKEQQQ